MAGVNFVRRVCEAGARIFEVPPEKLFLRSPWKPGQVSNAEEAIAYTLWATGMDVQTISGALGIDAQVRVQKASRLRCADPAFSAKVGDLFMIAHRGARA